MLIAMAIFQMIVDVAIFPELNLRYTLVDCNCPLPVIGMEGLALIDSKMQSLL